MVKLKKTMCIINYKWFISQSRKQKLWDHKVYAWLHELASQALCDSVSLSVRSLYESGSILKDHYSSILQKIYKHRHYSERTVVSTKSQEWEGNWVSNCSKKSLHKEPQLKHLELRINKTRWAAIGKNSYSKPRKSHLPLAFTLQVLVAGGWPYHLKNQRQEQNGED